ncbi:hypothetical protein BDQ17DRAFT_1333706 [Cyathus striatus]|nr:hypothetical protein BDQ17DRAFT_1333706 [Cyathus striatus]
MNLFGFKRRQLYHELPDIPSTSNSPSLSRSNTRCPRSSASSSDCMADDRRHPATFHFSNQDGSVASEEFDDDSDTVEVGSVLYQGSDKASLSISSASIRGSLEELCPFVNGSRFPQDTRDRALPSEPTSVPGSKAEQLTMRKHSIQRDDSSIGPPTSLHTSRTSSAPAAVEGLASASTDTFDPGDFSRYAAEGINILDEAEMGDIIAPMSRHLSFSSPFSVIKTGRRRSSVTSNTDSSARAMNPQSAPTPPNPPARALPTRLAGLRRFRGLSKRGRRASSKASALLKSWFVYEEVFEEVAANE